MTGLQLKVFISWSGATAKHVASALREFLPKMFDGAQPWMSDSDIASGTRPMAEIQDALEASAFAIIVVTNENIQRPWINFEAGAISRVAENRVVPFLIDVEIDKMRTSPLNQFQARAWSREGTLSLVRDLGTQLGISTTVIDDRFAGLWSKLHDGFMKAPAVDKSRRPALSHVEPEGEILPILHDLREIAYRQEQRWYFQTLRDPLIAALEEAEVQFDEVSVFPPRDGSPVKVFIVLGEETAKRIPPQDGNVPVAFIQNIARLKDVSTKFSEQSGVKVQWLLDTEKYPALEILEAAVSKRHLR